MRYFINSLTMAGAETTDFFNLDTPNTPDTRTDRPSFTPEQAIINGAQRVNPDAASRVSVLPPDKLKQRQDSCNTAIMSQC